MTTTPQAFARPKGRHEQRAGGPTAASAGRRSLRREQAVGFRRALGLTALGTLLPGAGLTRTGGRCGLAPGHDLLALLGLVVAGFMTRGLQRFGLDVITHSATLTLVVAVFLIGGVVWCASIIATAVLARPRRLDPLRTRALAVFTTIMVILVGALPSRQASTPSSPRRPLSKSSAAAT